MTPERNPDPQTVWKEQPVMTHAITMHDLERRDARLDRQLRRRNRFEYLAAALAGVVLLFAGAATLVEAAMLSDVLMGAGFLTLAAALGFVCLQIHRRSAVGLHGDPAQDGLAFHRARLARERSLLRTAWLWYVGPMVPGFALIYGSMLLEPEPRWTFALVGGGLTLLLLVSVALLNRRAAGRLDREIAELDGLDR